MQTAPMSLSQLFLSFNGRISRSTFWLKFYIPIMVITVVTYILDFSFGTFSEEYGVGLFSGICSVLILYPTIAVYVKRFHDRNRSGWFCLLLFVPLVNLWPGIEMMFLRGTEGPNRFGEDPVGGIVDTSARSDVA